jgi:hypothetical protein
MVGSYKNNIKQGLANQIIGVVSQISSFYILLTTSKRGLTIDENNP